MNHVIPAELIIENVSVITMDPQRPFATGVAVSGGRVLQLFQGDEALWPVVQGGQRLNGNGLTLIPGLIDAHIHLRAQLSNGQAVSCGREHVKSIEQIIKAVRERANLLPKGTWIRAEGYNPFYLVEGRHPNRWDLDEAAPDHPVRLRYITRHATVLNSPALVLAGIEAGSSDPPGAIVEREPVTGEPTGLIYGGDAWLSQRVIPPLTSVELQAGVTELQTLLLSRGITAVQDATITNNLADLLFWETRIREEWPIAVQLMSGEDNHSRLSAILAREAPSDLSGRLELGPVKVIMETASPVVPGQRKLELLALETHRRGIPLAIHVVDPTMVWMAVEAIRTAKEKYPNPKVRHRLEHLSLCPEAFLPEIAEQNITVVTNPGLLFDHGDRYLADVPSGEHEWLYPMGSLLAAGIPLAGGSDSPIATFDPWVGIQAACTRATSSGSLVGLKEKLERWQALALYTSSAAYAAGWDGRRGMLRQGYRADLLLLDRNPLTCTEAEISSTRVCATWIEGRLVHQDNDI